MRITKVIYINYLILFILTSECVFAAERPIIFTDVQRSELTEGIKKEIKKSDDFKRVNQKYDIAFKSLLFIMSALAAIGAARVAALGDKVVPSTKLKTINLALTALVPLITALAFTQFDFSKRQEVWEKRYYALQACSYKLNYFQVNKEIFMRQLETIMQWTDSSNPRDLTASCNSEAKPAITRREGA